MLFFKASFPFTLQNAFKYSWRLVYLISSSLGVTGRQNRGPRRQAECGGGKQTGLGMKGGLGFGIGGETERTGHDRTGSKMGRCKSDDVLLDSVLNIMVYSHSFTFTSKGCKVMLS